MQRVDTSVEPPSSPSFDAPPVSEAVLGIEFDPIDELGAIRLAQIASLWSPSSYPKIKEVPGIPPLPQTGDVPPPAFALHMGPTPPRLWLLSDDESDLLQLQNDRLIVNWRKTRPDAVYPRYTALYARLEKHWREFSQYLREYSLALPMRVTVECTYVNIFPFSGDISRALSIFSRPANELPGTDEGVQFQLMRRIASNSSSGRLMVSGGPNSVGVGDAAQAYNLTVTTKVQGAVSSGGFAGELLAEAHAASVAAFTSITTSENHAHWRRVE